MQKNDSTAMCLPDWFPKYFLRSQWYVYSTDRNENGRTPFVLYLIMGRQVHALHGEILDSKEDYESFEKMNAALEDFRRESNYKQAMSMLDARNVFLD